MKRPRGRGVTAPRPEPCPRGAGAKRRGGGRFRAGASLPECGAQRSSTRLLTCVPSGARKRQGPSPPGPRRGLLRGSGREPAGPGPRSQRGDAQLLRVRARAQGRPRQPPCSDGTDHRSNVACRVVVVVAVVVVATTSGRTCRSVVAAQCRVGRSRSRGPQRAKRAERAQGALITRRTLVSRADGACAWVWWSYGGGLRRGGAVGWGCFFGGGFFAGAGRLGSYSRQKVRMRATYAGVSPFSGT